VTDRVLEKILTALRRALLGYAREGRIAGLLDAASLSQSSALQMNSRFRKREKKLASMLCRRMLHVPLFPPDGSGTSPA
jgi:hypothetical protein